MKKKNVILAIAFYAVTSFPPFGGTKGGCQRVGINPTGALPNSAAMLDVDVSALSAGNKKGLLIPRMTSAQRNAIPSPATGLLVYNTDTKQINFYNGTFWRNFNDVLSSSTVAGGTGTGGGVAMNINGTTVPNPSSILDVQSTTRGLLFPRTITDSITSPLAGLMIYSTANNRIKFHDGSVWQSPCDEGTTSAVGGSQTIAGIAINTTGSLPDQSAMLDVTATNAGLLLPRITATERNALPSPADGLIIYNSTDNRIEFYNNSQWRTMITNLPVAPVANAATNINVTSFSANWTASTNAVTYYLDVSTDISFASFVTGYNNLNVGNVTTYSVNSNLTCATTYYYRVRAGNACGTSANSNTITVTTAACVTCGGTFTDSRDGQTYTTVFIGGNKSPYCLTGADKQCWMAKNLNYNSGGNSWCYNNVAANCTARGRLYDWNNMMNGAASVATNGPGPQGICPAGWHIPTDNEWKCLEMNLGMSLSQADAMWWRGTTEGGEMKSTGGGWSFPNVGATNSSGFTALPGGMRFATSFTFGNIGSDGYWWTATLDSGLGWGWYRNLGSFDSKVDRDSHSTGYGLCVLCVKD